MVLFFLYNSLPLIFAAHSAVLLKAESMPDKVEWVNKIKAVIQSKGGSFKGPSTEGGSMKQSNSDGALVSSRLIHN
jgi:dynamin 1/3